ncbi:MAG: hypothetical protein KAS32_03030 [Candidatus Peribacteraceae bacterium]|nr:hypothetical protein [Candidatus Peribacteraceae bacterium]
MSGDLGILSEAILSIKHKPTEKTVWIVTIETNYGDAFEIYNTEEEAIECYEQNKTRTTTEIYAARKIT